MLHETSGRQSLPPLKKTKRTSKSPEILKIQRIHERHQTDWKRLEKKITSRYYTIKTNQENSFMREMWAFKDLSRSCVENIQDTSGFRHRQELALKNLYQQRLEKLFTLHHPNKSLI